MKTLIEFIDRYAIDPHIYVVAPQTDGPGRFELFWDREVTSQRWRLRLIGDKDWERIASSQVIGTLELRGVDVPRVEHQLRSVALAQVVFAESLTQEARQLFGCSSVEQAVQDHQAFLEELRSVVCHFARGRFKAIDGGGQGTGSRSGRLSLVAES